MCEMGFFEFVNIIKCKNFQKTEVWHSIVPAISKEHDTNTFILFSFLIRGGAQSPKILFQPFGPQFGLKIRGGPSPRSANDTIYRD